jgi:hypothetical protein
MVQPARTVHIPAGLLIDEQTRPEHLDAGTANVLNLNARIDESGALVRRLGYDAHATTRIGTGISARSSGRRLFTNGDQVCTVDSTPELDVFSTSLGRSVIRGRVPEATVRLREVPSANLYQPPPQPAPLSQATLWDMAVIEGGAAVGGTFAAFAYLTTDAAGDTFAQVSVIDADNGAVVVSPILLQAADAVTMASYGSIVLVFTMNAGSLDLYKFDATSFSTINIGWVSLGNLASDVDETANVQAVRVPAADAVAIAYKNTSGGASPLTVRKVNEFGAVTSTTIAATAGQLTMAGMCEGGTVLWIAWNQNGTIRAASLNE